MDKKCIITGCVLPPHKGRCLYRTAGKSNSYYHTSWFGRMSKEERHWRLTHPSANVTVRERITKIRLSKDSIAILQACAVLENIPYWDQAFITGVCKELEATAKRRNLKRYFRHDGQVNLDFKAQPVPYTGKS